MKYAIEAIQEQIQSLKESKERRLDRIARTKEELAHDEGKVEEFDQRIEEYKAAIVLLSKGEA
ncbi:hypothetical protein C0431_12520 [bacterium]|nr:hypothetical protein [bacterium]